MTVILYTIDCPKCLILEKKLTAKGIEFTTVKDKELMLQLGFSEVPMLRIVSGGNGNYVDFNFTDAVQWINKQ